MTKFIKGEFEKIKDVKVEDVSLTCDTLLEVFNNKVSRLSGMDDDLFTYEVEVANIPCDSKIDDDSKHEADDDMGYDPSDIRGDDEDELTDEESSDDMDEVVEDSKPMKIIRMIGSMNGIKMYHGCTTSHGLIKEYGKSQHQSNIHASLSIIRLDVRNGQPVVGERIYQDLEWYEALEDCELKDEALRNKDIMEGFINEGDDESHYEQERRWIYTNYDDAYEINREDNKREELCEVHELPLCNIRRYMMIKYSFNNDEEYVAIKEDEYDDLTITRKEACRAYQEIFRIIDKGWMVTRAE
ncbi:hypothetical protein Tco_0944087 [Tanacetum coccineum]